MSEVDAVVVRDYRSSDFESIWQLDQECFPRGIAYSRFELRTFLARGTAERIVAERDGRIIAFVLGSRRGRADADVITLDVAASVRRRGLGRQLLVDLEGRFRVLGVQRMHLEVATANAIAIEFYERLGYRRVARLIDYYGPDLHAWKMVKSFRARRDTGPTPVPRATHSSRERGRQDATAWPDALRVADCMTRGVATIHSDALARGAAAMMRTRHIRHLPVVDREGGLVGIVTDRDLRQVLFNPLLQARLARFTDALKTVTVRDVMTWAVLTVQPDTPLRDAARLMYERKIGALPVVARGRVVGMLSELDIVKRLARPVAHGLAGLD